MKLDQENRSARIVHYVKAAQKALNDFPEEVRIDFLTELELFRQGEPTRDIFRMQGSLHDVYEIKESDRTGTYRVMFTAIIDGELWVLHAFQKKSTLGIATPKHDLELIHQRLKKVKNANAARRR